MPKLSKVGNRHRLRFTICFPDGVRLERSRLIGSARQAKSRLEIAGRIEVQTARQEYTARDVMLWHNARLISRADRARLERDLPGAGKKLSDCLDEWESTWTCGLEEARSRSFRRKRILRILGDPLARSLTYDLGLKLILDLRSLGLKVATVRKYVQDLKRAINHQVAIRYLKYNPFATLSAGRIPAQERIKQTILTDAQIRQVLDEARKKDALPRPQLGGTLTLHLLMFFGLGIRRKEAILSRWEHINWKQRSITLPAEITKTHQERTIGLGRGLYIELWEKRRKTGYILPRFAPWSISRAIHKHLLECGITARLHDARHTYTTMLQDLGVAPHRAKQRTGHADMRMLSHYSHGDFDQVYEDSFGFLQDENSKKRRKTTKKRKNKRS